MLRDVTPIGVAFAPIHHEGMSMPGIDDVREAVRRAQPDKPQFGNAYGMAAGQIEAPERGLGFEELEAIAHSARERGYEKGYREASTQQAAQYHEARVRERREARTEGVLGGLSVAIEAIESLPRSKRAQEILEELRGLRRQVRDEGVDA